MRTRTVSDSLAVAEFGLSSLDSDEHRVPASLLASLNYAVPIRQSGLADVRRTNPTQRATVADVFASSGLQVGYATSVEEVRHNVWHGQVTEHPHAGRRAPFDK